MHNGFNPGELLIDAGVLAVQGFGDHTLRWARRAAGRYGRRLLRDGWDVTTRLVSTGFGDFRSRAVIERPPGFLDAGGSTLYGPMTLQAARAEDLYGEGYFDTDDGGGDPFSDPHLQRSHATRITPNGMRLAPANSPAGFYKSNSFTPASHKSMARASSSKAPRNPRKRQRTGVTKQWVKNQITSANVDDDPVTLNDHVSSAAVTPAVATQQMNRIVPTEIKAQVNDGGRTASYGDREGMSVHTKSVQMNFRFKKHATPPQSGFRVIVVRFNGSQHPQLGNVLANLNTAGAAINDLFIAPWLGRRDGDANLVAGFKILWDKTYWTSTGLSEHISPKIVLPDIFGKEITYDGIGYNDETKGGLWYAVIGDNATSIGTYDVNIKTKYSS